MEINPLGQNYVLGKVPTTEKAESPTQNSLDSFGRIFENAVDKVNDAQKGADLAIEMFAAGQMDVHRVMIEVEKANTTLQLAIQLRDKMVEAYQEVMRMQM